MLGAFEHSHNKWMDKSLKAACCSADSQSPTASALERGENVHYNVMAFGCKHKNLRFNPGLPISCFLGYFCLFGVFLFCFFCSFFWKKTKQKKTTFSSPWRIIRLVSNQTSKPVGDRCSAMMVLAENNEIHETHFWIYCWLLTSITFHCSDGWSNSKYVFIHVITFCRSVLQVLGGAGNRPPDVVTRETDGGWDDSPAQLQQSLWASFLCLLSAVLQHLTGRVSLFSECTSSC